MAKLRSGYGPFGRSTFAVAGLVAAGIGGLSATEPAAADRSPEFRQCVRGSGGVTAAMQDCMADEYRRLDRALNRSYRDALRRLPSDAARSQLQASQRTWLKTRGNICDDELARSGMAGGSGGQLVEASCRLRILSDRTQWLRAYPQPIPQGR
ncbi:lysozyme inhibitor LprI family protein [Sphingopyxis sp.]|uniref:lysozyme inhibitor LprI family protein n=1 Tax=Sphingopyxis sp. TaxID=1908224 RepID=UPI003D15145B